MQVKLETLVAGATLAAAALGIVAGLISDGFGRNAPNMSMASMAGTAPGPALLPIAMTRSETTMAPPNYIGRNLQLFEAHWQGMDGRLLDSELRQKLKYPRGLEGVLIDEVTLNAVQAELLAGDVITKVEGAPVRTLEEFQQQTKRVRNRRQASITVFRKGQRKEDGRYVMKRITMMLRTDSELGFAQVEGAPMIKPGDGRPHPYRGLCTQCHAVGVGFELSPDPDLITLQPAPISREIAVKGITPHRNRGPCEACHVITQ